MKALLIVVLLLASIFVGCLQDQQQPTSPTKRVIHAEEPTWDAPTLNATLSQPRFPADGVLAQDFWHTSWDGTQLHTRIYRVADPGDWKSPIILHMSPYFGPNNAPANKPTGNGLDGWLLSYFLPRGYAIALNDVRGTGESGGCLEQTGQNQWKDEFLIIEELAKQPWASGKVGTIGKSYDAETQQSAAVVHPPHLTTIIPVSSVAGQYEWNFYDGIPYQTNGVAGMVSYMAIGVEPGGEDQSTATYPERLGCHPENLEQGADPRGDFNQYWKDREIRLHVDEIQGTSVFQTHGFEDWNVKPNNIRNWFERIPTPKHAWFGQWQHDYPDGNTFRPEWSRSDFRLTVARWFDHWLLGLETGIMDEPNVQVMDSLGRWRFEDTWPPAHATTSRLYPDPSANLVGLPVRDGSVSYTDNGLSMDASGDFVEFVTQPLETDLHYAGWPLFNFTAQIDGAPAVQGTHFALQLIDVAGDRSENIINRGYLSAEHRDGLETSKPVPLGQPVEYHLRLFPQDDVVQAGHSLKIKLGAVDDWIQPEGTTATITLLLGGEKSYLDLPLIDDATARFFTPLDLTQ